MYKRRKHCSIPSLTSLSDIRQTRAPPCATAMSTSRSPSHKAHKAEPCSWQTQEVCLPHFLFGGKALEGTKTSSCVLCQPLHRKVKFLPEKSLWSDSLLLCVLKTYCGPLNLLRKTSNKLKNSHSRQLQHYIIISMLFQAPPGLSLKVA